MGDPITTAMTTAATAALGAVAKKAIEELVSGFVDQISAGSAKYQPLGLQTRLNKEIQIYLEANFAKCETLKTLLNRNNPVPLKDCFVAPDFRYRENTVSSDSLLNEISESHQYVVVTGPSGSGKSVFLKYAFRHVIESKNTRFPIFFELRTLNMSEMKKDMLLSEIFETIHDCCESFSWEKFKYGMNIGSFYFILDGFDEVNHDVRGQISDEISKMARNFKCPIIVASRPSDEFISWEGFSEVDLLPFDLEKSAEYVSKINFEEDKKSNFIADLRDGLFEKNKEFLSNPLLSAMMLLTYGEFNEIPEKKHVFYAKCFEVLSREHDATKGRYTRKLHSNMSMDDIKRVFMFFCAFSHYDEVYSFSGDKLHYYIEIGLSMSGIEADVREVIRDFLESITILERDGLEYRFAHRSFQEYFYANFCIEDRNLSLDDKISHLFGKFEIEIVKMIADMDRIYFEDDFLTPYMNNLWERIRYIDPESNPSGIISNFFHTINIHSHTGNSIDFRCHTVYEMTNNISAYIFGLLTEEEDKNYSVTVKDNYFPESKLHSLNEWLRREGNSGFTVLKVNQENDTDLIQIGQDLLAKILKQGTLSLCEWLIAKKQNRKTHLSTLIAKGDRGFKVGFTKRNM